jgi:hypothetical protein
MALVETIAADWLLLLDADERWLPRSGRLADCAALAGADVLSVPRFNVALGPRGLCLGEPLLPAGYADTLLFAKPIADFPGHLARHPETPWSRGVPVPKVMIRPPRVARLTAGQHEAVAGAAPVRQCVPADLLIAHLPFTTAARFRRKVANLRRTLEVQRAFFQPHQAWHWRRWFALETPEAVDAEFARQQLDEAEITALRAAGVLRSAAELLALSPSR